MGATSSQCPDAKARLANIIIPSPISFYSLDQLVNRSYERMLYYPFVDCNPGDVSAQDLRTPSFLAPQAV